MSSNTSFKFPLDGKPFTSKAALYQHIEENYSNMLSDEMPAARLYFNLKYNKTVGRSVISGKPTKWNPVTERYERFADENEKVIYREQFRERMMQKYGKTHLTDDPEHQKVMLSNRSIAQFYKWQDGTQTKVTGTYEEHFLHFIESVYHFKAEYLAEPPTIFYKDEDDKVRFYLPDFYIPSLNLIIEVKGSNEHYQQRDAYKERMKREATVREGFDFVQIQDKFYSPFNVYFHDKVLSSN
jgi:hypothetical protein